MALQHVPPARSNIAGPDEHLAALRRERGYAVAKGKPTDDIDAEIERFATAAGLSTTVSDVAEQAVSDDVDDTVDTTELETAAPKRGRGRQR